MMGLLWNAIAGIVAGFIAGKIMPGEEPGGIWGLLGFGLVGGILGKLALGMLGNTEPGMIMSIIASVAGACLVIFIWKKFIGPMIGGGNTAT